ncbi:MAG: patatin [Flammeovirgaceae bacterium]|nr:patatin [Flammeovirgaceae bacterium]HCX20552.1 patatin [Cytophagales bacterium]
MSKQVSLVLSGGGARGIAHIGVLEELERRGYKIHSVVGTSMGALVGGVYALGKLDEFKKWLFKLDKRKVFSLVDFTFSKQGLVRGDKVLEAMKQFIPDTNIEDLPIGYGAVAVDILKGEERLLDKGSVYEAIRASIAIPTVFTPKKSETTLLVDGGVLNNIPVNHASRIPDDLLVAINVNADVPPEISNDQNKIARANNNKYLENIAQFYEQLKRLVGTREQKEQPETLGYFDLINKTITLMMTRIADNSLERYKPDILIKVSSESASIFDFYKAEKLVEEGREVAKKALDQINFK